MECDGCTLCCKVLDIPWMDSPRGFYCKECEPDVGCKIWDTVSEDCKNFSCAYRSIDKIDIKYRPDKCGVVFEKATDTIFFGTIDPHLNDLNETVINQINSFLAKGFSCVLQHAWLPNPIVFNTEDRTSDDVWNELKEVVKKKYDSTSL